jgi:hypothetical protein
MGRRLWAVLWAVRCGSSGHWGGAEHRKRDGFQVGIHSQWYELYVASDLRPIGHRWPNNTIFNMRKVNVYVVGQRLK